MAASGSRLRITLDIQRFWANAQSLPIPSQVSRQKKKSPHVDKTQAYVSPNYMSGDNIPESGSSKQGMLVHFNLSRVKKGEMDLKSVHDDPGQQGQHCSSRCVTWDCKNKDDTGIC